MRKIYKSLKCSKIGIGLIETLVGGAIGSVMVAGTMKSLQLSLESNLVAKATLAEMDVHHTIRQALQGSKQDCLANFTPKTQADPNPYAQGLYGADREWGIGEVFQLYKGGVKVLEKGQAFKGSLEIVKMSLKGVKPTTDPNSKKITTGTEVIRDFVVYYKKVNMGSYSTLAGNPCTESDLSGCYFEQCGVTLRVDDDGDDDTTPAGGIQVCNSGTCANYGSQGSGPPPCYKVGGDENTAGNTLVGCGSTEDITATGTTAIGYNAGASLQNTGNFNTILGVGAGFRTTLGDNSIFVGWGAGSNNTTGSHNTFLGHNAGYNDPTQAGGTGSNNIAIGSGVKVDSLSNNNQINIGNIFKSKSQNLFIGNKSGDNNTGNNNTFLGDRAGEKNTSGEYNTFVGRNAGSKNNRAHRNTFIGEATGRENTTGANNTFLGTGAGILNTTASRNTFVGRAAGEQVTTAGGNTFIGTEAGKQTSADDPSTTDYAEGTANVFVGIGAGLRNTTGAENTIIGAYAGLQSTSQTMTGSNNLFLGNRAGKKNTTGRGNIFIGNDAGAEVTTGVDNVYIGNNVGNKSNMQGINNLTNISNRVLMKKSTRTLSELGFADSEIRALGTLKVCSQTNTNCKNVVLPQLCPTGQVLRGFNTDGTKNCQSPSPTITISTRSFMHKDGTQTFNVGSYDFCALSTAEKRNNYCKHYSVGHSCHLTKNASGVWRVQIFGWCGDVTCAVQCFNFN